MLSVLSGEDGEQVSKAPGTQVQLIVENFIVDEAANPISVLPLLRSDASLRVSPAAMAASTYILRHAQNLEDES